MERKNPANFFPSNYIGVKIADEFANTCKNSYNLGLKYGLNGVAYAFGQSTTIVGGGISFGYDQGKRLVQRIPK